MKVALLVATIGAPPVSPPAQSPAATSAAATITEADVKRRIHIVPHDSMGGRDTPSRGLDLTARWVAGEFKRPGARLMVAVVNGPQLAPVPAPTTPTVGPRHHERVPRGVSSEKGLRGGAKFAKNPPATIANKPNQVP